KVLKATLIIILLLLPSTAAYSQEEPVTSNEQTGSAQEKAAAAKDDNLLPFQKEGWQFFVAPYLWIPGIHADVSHQGQFSGTTIVDVPWYDVVPLLFSKAMGGMGRVEAWNGRWGLFSDTNFVYVGESVSASGGTELKLNPSRLPITIPVNLQLSGTAKFWTRLLFQDVGVRYLLGSVPLSAEKPLPVLTCELLGGLRYTYLNQDTSLGLNATLSGPFGNVQISRGGSFFDSANVSIVEPLLGLRLGFWITPKLNLILKADCGGFGFVAYNNVDSVIDGLVGYQVSKSISIYAGYRGRYASASSNSIAIHGWLDGPMLGTVFSF
ncbi:MAG: hypothetical protein WA228_12560, partial [Desulfobaccales bacterium]